MKNGYLKSDNQKVAGYTPANDIEYKGMPLGDYIENELHNLKHYITHSQSFYIGGNCRDLLMDTTGAKQYRPLNYFTSIPRDESQRIFDVDTDTGDITVISDMPTANAPTHISFQADVFHDTADGVTNILRIQVIRNGNNITNQAQCQEYLTTATKHYCMFVQCTVTLQKGDIIRFTNETGTAGAKSYRNNFSISITPTALGGIEEL